MQHSEIHIFFLFFPFFYLLIQLLLIQTNFMRILNETCTKYKNDENLVTSDKNNFQSSFEKSL